MISAARDSLEALLDIDFVRQHCEGLVVDGKKLLLPVALFVPRAVVLFRAIALGRNNQATLKRLDAMLIDFKSLLTKKLEADAASFDMYLPYVDSLGKTIDDKRAHLITHVVATFGKARAAVATQLSKAPLKGFVSSVAGSDLKPQSLHKFPAVEGAIVRRILYNV